MGHLVSYRERMGYRRSPSRPLPATLPKDARIYVAHPTAPVGAALVRLLEAEGFANRIAPPPGDLDPRDPAELRTYFRASRPELAVVPIGTLAQAERERGADPVNLLDRSLTTLGNLLREARCVGLRRLLVLTDGTPDPGEQAGSDAERRLAGAAAAHRVAVDLCRAHNREHGGSFLVAKLPEVYGPGGPFDRTGAGLLHGLLRAFHLGRLARRGLHGEVVVDELRFGAPPTGRAGEGCVTGSVLTLPGGGGVRSEFLHADDAAAAVLFLLRFDERAFREACARAGGPTVDVGTDRELSVRELARMARDTVGYAGRVAWERPEAEVRPAHPLDSRWLEELGWRPRVALEAGMRRLYEWYLTQTGDDLGFDTAADTRRAV